VFLSTASPLARARGFVYEFKLRHHAVSEFGQKNLLEVTVSKSRKIRA